MKKGTLGKASMIAAFIAMVAIVLTGCGATATKTTSNKAPSYVAQPKRIYAVLAINSAGWNLIFSDLDKIYTDAFTDKMKTTLRECGVEFEASVVAKELTAEQLGAAAEAFNPDVLLAMTIKSYKQLNAQIVEATYDTAIHTMANQEMVWRANLVFDLDIVAYGGGMMLPPTFYRLRGADLAVDLTNQMKADGILVGCPKITKK